MLVSDLQWNSSDGSCNGRLPFPRNDTVSRSLPVMTFEELMLSRAGA
jgi:hypothetical protein